MKFAEIELPSNRKFGFFFTLVFAIATGYFLAYGSLTWVYIFGVSAIIFFATTIVKADALLFLNKLWMRFGLFLGMIVSPIVIGVIFFGIFTPIAFLMRLYGRDELRLQFKKQSSYWIKREPEAQLESFKNQF